MKKIYSLEQIPLLRNSFLQNSKVVLAGGCFDVLHKGHLAFLEAAKKQGDTLVLLLESDKTIRKIKGEHRPINTQKNRAIVLASLPIIDAIILLSDNMTNKDYDALVLALKPAIIATTKGDPGKIHKERQARLVHASVVDVIDRIQEFSTTSLSKKI